LSGENLADPCAYRLVLSPSCDLVRSASRRAKVEKALVARCTGPLAYRDAVASSNRSGEKLNERIAHALTEPHCGGFVPLPSFGNEIPPLAANLRSLDLVDIDDVSLDGSSGKTYVRLVSIDSPFREHIGWAYLSIAGRPGVPDVDTKEWSLEMTESSGAGRV
jgi:hypothetical protein